MSSSGVHRYWPFWVYLFCAAALIGLALVDRKLNERQRAIEQAALLREAVARNEPGIYAGKSPEQAIPFWPIYSALGIAAIVCGGLSLRHVLIRRRIVDGDRSPGLDDADTSPISSLPKDDA